MEKSSIKGSSQPNQTRASDALNKPDTSGYEKATFAAGCFWGVEAQFRQLKGVVSTQVGYTGGHLDNPTYKAVCTDKTGHAEAVQVEFDPNQITYRQLLDIFWQIHDPTTLNRQCPDVGTQYRSAIFFHNDGQQAIAAESLAGRQKKLKNKIATEITPAGVFWPAEEYHQRYLEKQGKASCHSGLCSSGGGNDGS